MVQLASNVLVRPLAGYPRLVSHRTVEPVMRSIPVEEPARRAIPLARPAVQEADAMHEEYERWDGLA